jgi:MFS family permease
MATSAPEMERDTGHYGDEAESQSQKSDVVEPSRKLSDAPEKPGRIRQGEKYELLDTDAPEVLGYAFPTWRKWQILIVVFCIQISMNLNASLYANGVKGISEKFGVSEQVARIPQMMFLIAYAFGTYCFLKLSSGLTGLGCEFWAPWSEEIGRWPIQQASLFLVNIWQIPCALAPNYATFVVCRTLGGVSTAGMYGFRSVAKLTTFRWICNSWHSGRHVGSQ